MYNIENVFDDVDTPAEAMVEKPDDKHQALKDALWIDKGHLLLM